MKKIRQNVLYISKQFTNIQNNNPKIFPFLNSQLFTATAMNQIYVQKIQAICNYNNIHQFYPFSGFTTSPLQFVFFGRSNVGKSSLLNKLISKKFVQESKKPGKTKDLTFLKLKFPVDTMLIDAPGYGYASDASKQQIKNWGKLIQYYLKHSDSMKQNIMLLCDLSIGLKQTDGMLLNLLHNYKKNFILVYTKSDKASDQKYDQGIQIAKKLQQKFINMNFYVHFTSCKTEQGIIQLRNHILFKLTNYIQRQNSK